MRRTEQQQQHQQKREQKKKQQQERERKQQQAERELERLALARLGSICWFWLVSHVCDVLGCLNTLADQSKANPL